MPRLRALLAALSLATIVACDSSLSAPDIDPSFAKGGGGAPIKVQATDPTGAPQDTTVEVRVLGSGFDQESRAAFLLAGSPTPGVVTNDTRFVSDVELVAEITIALDADVALYDVEVASLGRRRGIGTELFAVLQKGGGPPSEAEPMRVQVPLDVRVGTANAFEPDIHGVYDHGDCGVQAAYVRDIDHFMFAPKENGLTKKQERELERDCSDEFPRSALIRLDLAVVHLGGEGGHGDDVALTDYILDEGADLITPDDQTMHSAQLGDFALIGDGESVLQGRGFTLRYCQDDGRGQPMRFDPVRMPGSSQLELSRSGDVITARSQPYPNNIAGCEHGRDDRSITYLLLHLDVAYTVKPLP